MSDLRKSIERVGKYWAITVPLNGTLSAQDYLGNTGGDEGVPIPQGSIEEVHVTLSAADDGNSTVQIENENEGTTHSFDLEADTFTQETGIGLHFSEDEELSVTVSSVTTPGDGLSAVVYVDVDTAPMN